MGLMENGGGLSVADALALQDRGGNNDMGMFGGNGSWVFFLFFLLAWGNGGMFGGNGGGAAASTLANGLNQQDLFRNQANIMQEIGAFERDATNNWGDMKYDNLQGVNTLMATMNNMRADAAKCCCETNRNIDAVRYENAKNTCDITNNANFNARDIIEAQNAGVQRIIDFMTNNQMQELRDQVQTANLVSKLRPCPVPAYPSCSPYQTFYPNGCMGGNCGGY